MYYTLITGASSGIGFELAHEFAKNGHALVLVARSTNKLADLKRDLEQKYKVLVEVITCDLGIKNSAAELYRNLQQKNIKLNTLVNNAGFGDHSEFKNSSLEKSLEMIQLNITTLTELTRLYVNELIQNAPSKILNVASIASFQAGPLMAVYYATKAYVLSFSEALYVELKNVGVTVTALCPGPTTSGFMEVANFANPSYVSKLPFPTSSVVAQYGYRKASRGQAVAIHGVLNNVMVFAQRFMPRWLVRRIVYSLQKKRSK